MKKNEDNAEAYDYGHGDDDLRGLNLTGTEKLIMMYIRRRAYASGHYWERDAAAAADLEVGLSTLRKALAKF